MTGRVLLTGGSGFVAAQVAPRLRDLGLDVITCDRRPGSALTGDLADAAFTRGLPDVDAVVHTAAVQYVSSDLPRLRRRRFFDRHNVAATSALVERYGGRVDHVVNIATSMMFTQDGRALYGADAPLGGEGVYSRSKLQAVGLVNTMRVPTATVVPCIIAGRGREGLFRGFVESMTKRGVAVCPGTGDHVTQMVHVQDVADLIAILVRDRVEGTFNAGGPDPLSVRRWIELIAEELKLQDVRTLRIPYPVVVAGAAATRYRFLAREQMVMLGRDHVLDTGAALAIGWRPNWTNESIVRDTARYIAGSPSRVLAA